MIISFLKNPKVILGGLSALILIAFSFWVYSIHKENQKQKQEIRNFQIALQIKEAEIEAQKHLYEKSITIRDSINQQNNTLQERVSELQSKFNKRDFSYLAYKQPGLIEKRINDATEKKIQCLNVIADKWIDCN